MQKHIFWVFTARTKPENGTRKRGLKYNIEKYLCSENWIRESRGHAVNAKDCNNGVKLSNWVALMYVSVRT